MGSHILLNIYAPILDYLEFEPYAIAASGDLAEFVDESGADALFWDFAWDDLHHHGLYVWERDGHGPIECNLGDPEMLPGTLRRARSADLSAVGLSAVEPSGPDRLYVAKHSSAPGWLINLDVRSDSLPGLDVLQSLTLADIVYFGDEEQLLDPGIWCVEGDFAHSGDVDDSMEQVYGFEDALHVLDVRSANVRRVTNGELQWLLADQGVRLANMEGNLDLE